MFRTAILLAAFPFIAGQAVAAGFEGSYFGVNLGGFMATTDTDQSIYKPIVGGGGPTGATHVNTIAGVAATNASPEQSSILGGIHGGYNWRFGSLVVGAEAELGYWGYSASATAETTFPLNNPAITRTVRSTNAAEATYLFTLRPRIGFALSERSLIHASFGIAYADLEYGNVTTVTALAAPAGFVTYRSSASSDLGWILGAGYEHAWSDRLSLRIDYQYVTFDRTTSTGTVDPQVAPTDLGDSSISVGYETKMHVLRLGVNWRF